MANLRLVISRDPKPLFEKAADGFLEHVKGTPENPFPSPPYLLALRQGGLRDGAWNLVFAAGIFIGGFIGSILAPHQRSMVPTEIFSTEGLLTLKGFTMMIGGGFLVGFGAAYAGGCTSGHGISGVADFQLPSFIAVASMFGAGMLTSWLIIPLIT